MKKTIQAAIVAAVTAVITAVHGFSLPIVGADTELNKWTRNISGVLAAAKTTGYPILLIMINDSSSGEGCSHCKMFVERTMNTPEFDAIIKDYKFYMVLLNYWGIDEGTSQPSYGGVPYSVFGPVFETYNADGGFPVVAVIRPDGRRYKSWGDSTNPGTRGTVLHQHIRQAIADLAPRNADTKFDLASESANMVSIQADSTGTPQPGTWKGIVTRSGGSGATGSVSISLSGSNAEHYSLSTTSLEWDASDGAKSFTVTGPSSFNGSLVADTITVSIQAKGFDGSEVSYGTSSQEVTFKDARVKQSLAEFAAANNGLQGLASGGGTWFVPSQNDGNVLEAIPSADSSLVFTATIGGILTVEAGRSSDRAISVSAADGTFVLASGEQERFGVAAGQKITFKVSQDAASDVAGFSKFSFSPLSVTLLKPTYKASIPYGDMKKDKSLVDFSWSATMQGCNFAVTCNGVTKDVGTATSGNALDLGLVSDAPETKSYAWTVRATYSADGIHGTAASTSSSSFEVVALPSFDLPAKVTAYKLVNAGIDLSVSTLGAGKITYSADNLPKGMTIDKKTGIVTGSSRATGNYDVTVTAKTEYGDTTAKFTLAVAKLERSYTRATYVGFGFNDAGDAQTSIELKIQTSGRWKAQIKEGASTTSLRGRLTSLVDGRFAVVSGRELNIALDPASGVWSGSSNGRKVFGGVAGKADAQWTGTWNSGVRSSASSTVGGWASAKVVKSGQVTFSGAISGQRFSSKGASVMFPASFVAANIPAWAGHGDVRFVYIGSRKVSGCYAFYSDGTLGGRFTFQSMTFDQIEGSVWSSSDIASLDGAMFKTVGGGNLSVPLELKGKKLSTAGNAYRMRISVTSKTGRLNVSYKNDGQAKASGVLYLANGGLKGSGGGSLSSDAFVFVIE